MPSRATYFAEVAYRWPGLAAVAASSARTEPPDPEDAEWLDGPGVVRWLYAAHVIESDGELGQSVARQLRRWRDGVEVHYAGLDRILTARGLHLHDVPDHLWMPGAQARMRGQHVPAAVKAKAVRRVRAGEPVQAVATDMAVSVRSVRVWAGLGAGDEPVGNHTRPPGPGRDNG